MRETLWRIGLLASVALGLSAISAPASACSCSGTTDIGTAMTRADIVVLGRVERRLGPDSSRDITRSPFDDSLESTVDVDYPAPVLVKVLTVLKGDAAGEISITTDFMCYRSFDIEDLKPGETFVFPIVEKTMSGLHVLPSCSHSAAKLVDGELYTNAL